MLVRVLRGCGALAALRFPAAAALSLDLTINNSDYLKLQPLQSSVNRKL
jgi:hypothetical protein